MDLETWRGRQEKARIEELEAEVEELQSIFGAMSHDLETPLVTILGFLKHIEGHIERGDCERALQDLQPVRAAASHTVDLLTQLLARAIRPGGQVGDGAPGSGLGLTISRRIVEQLGGRIWVESEGRGRGAAFHFTLPIAEPH